MLEGQKISNLPILATIDCAGGWKAVVRVYDAPDQEARKAKGQVTRGYPLQLQAPSEEALLAAQKIIAPNISLEPSSIPNTADIAMIYEPDRLQHLARNLQGVGIEIPTQQIAIAIRADQRDCEKGQSRY